MDNRYHLSLRRHQFTRTQLAIEETFGINIECRRKGYQYYIENEEILKSNSLKHWMIDSLSVSNVLMESSSLKDRILLENIPSGREYLQSIIHSMKQESIIHSMKQGKKLSIGKF